MRTFRNTWHSESHVSSSHPQPSSKKAPTLPEHSDPEPLVHPMESEATYSDSVWDCTDNRRKIYRAPDECKRTSEDDVH